MAASRPRRRGAPAMPAPRCWSPAPPCSRAERRPTPPISPPCAASIMARGDRMRLALLPELIRAMLRQAMKPVLVVLRRSWPYRRLLKGKMPDRIVFQPFDAASRRLEDADALLKGRFRFAGEVLDVKEGSVFDKAPPSRAWAEGLHGFSWLAALSAAGGESARV